MFQSEVPLVHCIFDEMKILLTTILRRFINADIVDGCKSSRELVQIDVTDTSNHLPLKKIDFVAEDKEENFMFIIH